MTSGHEIFKKYDRVPVILSSNTIKIKQTKFLVSRSDSLGTFVHFLKTKGYISIGSYESVYITDENRAIPSYSATLGTTYYHLKGSDGYLRLFIEKNYHWG